MNNLVIANINIRQDADGRYCLNDLHQAAGGEAKHRPNYWLETQQTKDIIAELEIAGIPAIQAKQKIGTFVARELVYSYAMWISPSFSLRVIRAYDALANGRTEEAERIAKNKHSQINTDATRSFKAFYGVAKLIGLDKNAAAISANNAVIKTIGANVLNLLGNTSFVSEVQEALLTPTDIGEQLGLKRNEANPLLEKHGFQTSYRDLHDKLCWQLTDTGKQYGVYHDTGKKHGDGTPVRQIRWYASVVNFLRDAGDGYPPISHSVIHGTSGVVLQ